MQHLGEKRSIELWFLIPLLIRVVPILRRSYACQFLTEYFLRVRLLRENMRPCQEHTEAEIAVLQVRSVTLRSLRVCFFRLQNSFPFLFTASLHCEALITIQNY